MADYSKKEAIKKAIGKVTLTDAAMPSRSYGCDVPCAVKCEEPKKIYPCLYLDAAQAPFLDGYEVGDELTFVVHACVIGHNKNESENYKSDEYRLEIKKTGESK